LIGLLRLARRRINELTGNISWQKEFESVSSSSYRTNARLSPGWYLLTIYTGSEGQRSTATFTAHSSSSSQRLGLRRYQRRLRVVHVGRDSRGSLYIENISGKMDIRKICCKRISSCQAKCLVFKKLARNNTHLLDNRCSDKLLSQYWREYNHILNSSVGVGAFFSYNMWIKKRHATHIREESSSISCRELAAQSFLDIKREVSSGELTKSEWVIQVGESDRINAEYVAHISEVLKIYPNAMVIYADSDVITAKGYRHNPFLRPAWNPDLLYSDPLYGRNWVIQGDLWNSITLELRSKGESPTPYRMTLEATQRVSRDVIIHLTDVMISWSVDDEGIRKRASPQTVKDINRFFSYHQISATASLNNEGAYGHTMAWEVSSKSALVSIIIPTRDQFSLLLECMGSIRRHSRGMNYEIILVDNNTQDRQALNLLEELSRYPDVLLIHDAGSFNYSRLVNKGVNVSRGNVLCLMNNDVVVLTDDWMRTLLSNALRSEIGFVGPKLLYNDGTIQHGGVLLGIGGIAGHAHKYFSSNTEGYQCRIQLTHNISAVTGACMFVKREVWDQLGGLDEDMLAVNYNDVDICLRALAKGYRNLFVPSIELIHHESKSRGLPKGAAKYQWLQERQTMEDRWRSVLQNDPVYHPFLTLSQEDFSFRTDGFPIVSARTHAGNNREV